jgi:hypothetical protein
MLTRTNSDRHIHRVASCLEQEYIVDTYEIADHAVRAVHVMVPTLN